MSALDAAIAARLADKAAPPASTPAGGACTDLTSVTSTVADMATPPKLVASVASQPTPPLPEGVAPIVPLRDDLARILFKHQNGQDRGQQEHIGPSEVGVDCDRRLAYRLRNVPPAVPARLAWAPLVGTWCHAGIAEALHQENERLGRERYLVERSIPIEPALIPAGNCDVYDVDTSTVVDWKLVGKTAMDRYIRSGPGRQYRTQAHLYGYGWDRAGLAPEHVAVAFLPRWSHTLDDAYWWTEPYDADVAVEALDRVARVLELGRVLTPLGDTWPSVIDADSGKACRYCPWQNWTQLVASTLGCPGDVAGRQAAIDRYADGLIA